jgi:ribosomal-protein-alanine N-acetyltransferase
MAANGHRIVEKGHRVYLRHPTRDDALEFLRMVEQSRALHRPWVYPPRRVEAFAAYADQSATDRSFGCLICHDSSHAIVGSANLTEIVRGVFQSAYLSFYGHASYSGQGLVKEGLQLLLRHAFGKLRMHRVEANVQPGNERSLGLVRSLGFSREGFSPRYLKIGGRWRDHERWALLAEQWNGRGG